MLRASLTSGFTYWVEGRTLACWGYGLIECIGEVVLALCLERVHLLGGSLLGSVAPYEGKPVGGLAVGAGPGLAMGARGRRHLVSINVGGGTKCFIEVCANEATNVGVVYLAANRKDSGFGILAGEDFFDNSVKLFDGWKVNVRSCSPLIPQLTRGRIRPVMRLERLQGGGLRIDRAL
eukprot:scaffold40279_cov18-Tisochrysis_lutea.AAC.1